MKNVKVVFTRQTEPNSKEKVVDLSLIELLKSGGTFKGFINISGVRGEGKLLDITIPLIQKVAEQGRNFEVRKVFDIMDNGVPFEGLFDDNMPF